MKYCEEYAALLDAFVDGECSPEEDLRVRDHLKSCPGCQNYIDLALAMRDAFPAAGDAEVPADFADRVMEAIRSGAAPRVRKRAPWKRALVSLAACCAIAVLLRFVPLGGLGSSTASLAGGAENHAAQSSSGASDSAPAEANLFFGAAGDSAGSSASDSTAGTGGSSDASGSSDSGSAATPKQHTAKKSSGAKKSAPAQPAQTPGAAIEMAPSAQMPASSGGSSSGGESSSPEAGSGSSGTVSGQAIPPETGNSLTLAPGGNQTVKTTYHKRAAFTSSEVGSALASYEGTASYDDSTQTTTTTYELEDAQFDAVIAQLNAADRVTVDDTAVTTLCCISVSS